MREKRMVQAEGMAGAKFLRREQTQKKLPSIRRVWIFHYKNYPENSFECKKIRSDL